MFQELALILSSADNIIIMKPTLFGPMVEVISFSGSNWPNRVGFHEMTSILIV